MSDCLDDVVENSCPRIDAVQIDGRRRLRRCGDDDCGGVVNGGHYLWLFSEAIFS